MGIFTPPNSCFAPDATRLWLVAVTLGLAVVGIGLLLQVGVFSRRMMRMRVAWWQQLPLVLLLTWAGVCAFEAVQAFISYRHLLGVKGLLGCQSGRTCITTALCLPPPPLRGPAQTALLGAACLLLFGWLAWSAFARRLRAAS